MRGPARRPQRRNCIDVEQRLAALEARVTALETQKDTE